MCTFSRAGSEFIWPYLMLHLQSAHRGALHSLLCWAGKPLWLMKRYLLNHSVICPYSRSTMTEIVPAKTWQMFTKTRLNEVIGCMSWLPSLGFGDLKQTSCSALNMLWSYCCHQSSSSFPSLAGVVQEAQSRTNGSRPYMSGIKFHLYCTEHLIS